MNNKAIATLILFSTLSCQPNTTTSDGTKSGTEETNITKQNADSESKKTKTDKSGLIAKKEEGDSPIPVLAESKNDEERMRPPEQNGAKSFDKISLGTPKITGEMHPTLADSIANHALPKLSKCFDNHQFKMSKANINVKVVIDKNGTVTSATVRLSTLDDKAVESCFAEQLKTWRYPALKEDGIVVVDFPFRMHFK